MKTDVQSLLFRDTTIAVTASSTVESQVIDMRKHGADRTKDLIIRIHVDKPTALLTTSATINIKTAAEATSGSPTFTTIATATLSASSVDANNEIIIPLPRTGVKDFLRADVVKGNTALAAAVKLFGGLDADDEYDIDYTLVGDGRQLD